MANIIDLDNSEVTVTIPMKTYKQFEGQLWKLKAFDELYVAVKSRGFNTFINAWGALDIEDAPIINEDDIDEQQG